MMKILLVDDKLENLYLLEKYLQGNGYSTVSASNGAEALAIALKSPPDMVVSDILMPEMDGFTFCREWRKDVKLQMIPFIFYTATYTDPKDEEFALNLGADRFIIKPMELNDFLTIIKETYNASVTKSGHPLHQIPPPEEKVFLKEYNETLIRKLEKKMTQIEAAEKELREKNAALEKDIKQRKQAEEQLLRHITYFRQLFDNSPEGIIMLDEKNKIINANSAFEKMFQYSLKEIEGRYVDEFIVPPEKREENFHIMSEVDCGRSVEKDTYRKRKDGTRIDVIAIRFPITIKETKVGAYGMYVDVSERKRLQEQLVHAQRMESIGTLAGGIAHDFNNILGIIMGHSTMLQKLVHDPAKRLDSTQTILQASQRGALLVRQMLTFARKQDLQIEPVEVNNAIKEVQKLLSETLPKKITISTSLKEPLPLIEVDATQLNQVLVNLCINARDAMPKGGSLKLSTAITTGESLKEKFSALLARQYVQINITDTGTGMNEETRRRIFEPFFTTKEIGKGTGLGLSVVFGIVQSHDGLIDVDSEFGRGPTFSVYFPVKPLKTKRNESEKELLSDVPQGSETLLIVEDEVLLRELLKVSLLGKGYTVLTAEDGEEAISLYKQRAATIALVISDYGLPKIDGHELLKHLKKINPSIKFILATGYIDPEQKSIVLKDGANEIIHKPYNPNEVMKTIRSLLDGA